MRERQRGVPSLGCAYRCMTMKAGGCAPDWLVDETLCAGQIPDPRGRGWPKNSRSESRLMGDSRRGTCPLHTDTHLYKSDPRV